MYFLLNEILITAKNINSAQSQICMYFLFNWNFPNEKKFEWKLLHFPHTLISLKFYSGLGTKRGCLIQIRFSSPCLLYTTRTYGPPIVLVLPPAIIEFKTAKKIKSWSFKLHWHQRYTFNSQYFWKLTNAKPMKILSRAATASKL